MCTPQGILEKLACLAFDETVKDVVKRRKYVLNYSANLEELRSEMTRLEDHWAIINGEVSVANDRGEVVENLVLHWQKKVEDLRKEFQELTQKSIDHEKMRCFACSCPNIKWRYRLSKQAEEKIVHVKKLIEDRPNDRIAHARPPPPELQCPSNENYENFASRTPIFKDIVEALKDASVNIIGIHGLGGVGKTTLVEEVGKKMRQDETFKQVTLAAISKDINVKEIQLKLAYDLSFRFDANVDDQKGRATQLWHKFNNGEKYLVILDDLWEEVDIKAIGIPITDGKTGCKVVLTSRKEDLLVRMKVDRHFLITELHKPEAWTLFKMKVGDSIESQLELHPLALKVCEKCKGLPVAINAIGAALQGKKEHTWRNVLFQLDTYRLPNIEDIDQSVWASLRVSYDMLRSPDAKSCFLLCCLFAEDAEIPLEDLMRYCVARGLLSQNSHTLEDARDAICTIIDALKSASLLSIGSNENVVRIHDVIRDVGISIARDEKAMLVDSGVRQWPQNPGNGPSYSVISLSSATIERLPDDLEYPQLHTLMFDNGGLTYLEVPDNFFVGMKQLTVLILARMQMWWLPSSLAKLPNLRMLCLNQCKLAEMSILGDLKTKLDVLSFQGSTIKELPPEIAQLTSLRLLDLRDCDDLELIPQGIISKLTNLEELYFAETFDQWEATMSKSKNMSLDELRSLLSIGRLTTLHIHIPAVTLLPKEDLMFKNLKKFRISMGSNFRWDEDFPGTRVLKYEGSSLRKEFIPLVDKAEALYLSGINDMNGLHPLQSFNKLSVLRIDNCKLKYLFSLTTARGLFHLEELQVKDCEIIEEIVGFEGKKDGNELIFSKLKILQLKRLPNLTSFYAEKEKMRTTKGSSSTRHQSLFNEKVILPVLEKLKVESLDSIEEIWDKQSPSVNEKTVSFSQLTDVTVQKCEKLMNLGPWNILSQLRNLQRLTVDGCPNVEFIVLFKNGRGEEEEADDSTLIIPLLRHLHIEKMEKLKSFYSSSTTANAQSLFNHQVILPVLEELKVESLDSIEEIWDKQSPSVNQETASFGQLRNIKVKGCTKLMNLVPSNILPRLRNLQFLKVKDCPNVEFVVFKNKKGEEDAVDDSNLIIPQLRDLRIWKMENLKSFYSSSTTSNAQSLFNHQVAFPVLEHIAMWDVPMITGIWPQQPLSKPEKEVESFCKLKSISVWYCDQLEYVLPSYMLPQLHNLLELEVHNCKELEVIVSNKLKEKEATNNDILEFPQLKDLTLSKLDNLKCFCTGTDQLLFSHKVAFPVLEYIAMWDVPMITGIWPQQPLSKPEKEVESFCKLKSIQVRNCDQLEYVLPSHTLPQLHNLRKLDIRKCQELEVIVSNKLKEKEATNNDILVFPQLKTLELWFLDNLKCFCTGTDQLLFSHKVAFPALEYLEIGYLSNITEIWDKKPVPEPEKEIESFSNLATIDIFGCDQLVYVLPSSYMLPLLQNLQTLKIKYCEEVEVIVSKELMKEKEAVDNDTIVFSQLKDVEFDDLPKLKSFYTGTQLFFSNKDAFPVLENIRLRKGLGQGFSETELPRKSSSGEEIDYSEDIDYSDEEG